MKDVIEIFENDFKMAQEQKSTINNDIEKWNKIYDGEPYGNEQDNHSDLVWKMVQKQGETLMANLAKPFINGTENVMVSPITDKDVYKSKIDEGILNHFHDKKFDKNRFYKDISRVIVKEGTGWIRVGWNKVNKMKSIEIDPKELTQESARQLEENGFRIVAKGSKVFLEKDNIIYNEPTAKVLKNGRIFTDPIADIASEMRFLIYEYETSASELKEQPDLYDEEAVAKVLANVESNSSNYYTDLSSAGRSSNSFTNYSDTARKKIKLYEYWGDYDIDKDGVPIPCVFVISGSRTDRIVLKVKKNPYPFKKIPFVPANCVTDLYNVWGKPIAYLIEDIQKTYSMIMRGVLDNMSGSNNAIKFIKKGALDTENRRRLMAKEPLVEINTTENINTAVMDGGFNQIPQAVFNMFMMLDQEAEAQTGITKMMQGISGAHMNSTTNNFNATLSMSQIRLLDITNNLTYAMKEVMNMWISMSLEYLDQSEIKDITGIDIDKIKIKETQLLMQEYGIDELEPEVAKKAQMIIMEEVEDLFSADDLEYDIKIKIGTDGLKEVRLNQLNMLMQQVGGLSQMVDPSILKDMLAEYADLMDFPAIATQIREFTPQPDPAAEQAQQLELAKMGAEAQKEAALAQNASARAEQIKVETQKSMMNTEVDTANKYADVASKYADVDRKNKDTDLREFEAGNKAGVDQANAETGRIKAQNDKEKASKQSE